MSWSEDGEIAIAAGEFVQLLVCRIKVRKRLRFVDFQADPTTKKSE